MLERSLRMFSANFNLIKIGWTLGYLEIHGALKRHLTLMAIAEHIAAERVSTRVFTATGSATSVVWYCKKKKKVEISECNL